jgi:hypothetical protein
MRVLKVRTFARWAGKESLSDAALLAAVDEMRRGRVDAELGGGLIKQRVARRGKGKRGGLRTLLAADRRERWIFIYGFAKTERGNVDDAELRALRRLARTYLAMSESTILRLLDAGELLEVRNGDAKAS